MRKKVGIIKRVSCISLVFLLSINSFAAIVSDNDGAAFITKAEFDALKNAFQAQIDQYNTSIDSKIDGAIASYLAGIQLSKHQHIALNSPVYILSNQVGGMYGENNLASPTKNKPYKYNGKYYLRASDQYIKNFSVNDITITKNGGTLNFGNKSELGIDFTYPNGLGCINNYQYGPSQTFTTSTTKYYEWGIQSNVKADYKQVPTSTTFSYGDFYAWDASLALGAPSQLFAGFPLCKTPEKVGSDEHPGKITAKVWAKGYNELDETSGYYAGSTTSGNYYGAVLWIFEGWNDTTASASYLDTCAYLGKFTPADWAKVVKLYLVTFTDSASTAVNVQTQPVFFDIEFAPKPNTTYYMRYRWISNQAWWINKFGKTWQNSTVWQANQKELTYDDLHDGTSESTSYASSPSVWLTSHDDVYLDYDTDN